MSSVVDTKPVSTVFNDIIPPTNVARPRTLVLCFDGTGDQFDNDNSNVVQFFSLLQKDDHTQQMVYYQTGIGTYTVPQVASPLASKISKLVDEAIAWHLDAHVMDGYTFLMQNYQVGDKISIFGFSRGAYTARALAGMIQKVGLLPASNHQQVPFAYKMYKKATPQGWKQSSAFKKAFSIDVDVDFVGVWDTVCSVGLISRRLPFVSSNSAIRYFRHAVSLDERRAKFKSNLYNRPTKEENALGVQPGEMPKSKPKTPSIISETLSKWVKNTTDGIASTWDKAQKEELEQAKYETGFDLDDNNRLETDVEEVWFSGCHSDVGGGSVNNEVRHSLARIPLRWMIRECFRTHTGIRFHSSLMKNVGLNPETLYPIVQERPPAIYDSPKIGTPSAPTHNRTETEVSTKTLVDGTSIPGSLTEEEEDLRDALSHKYDQLRAKKIWWVLELLPLTQRYQNNKDEWVEKMIFNFGRPRYIPDQTRFGFKVHRTVDIRMKSDALKKKNGKAYHPKAPFKAQPQWVA